MGLTGGLIVGETDGQGWFAPGRGGGAGTEVGGSQEPRDAHALVVLAQVTGPLARALCHEAALRLAALERTNRASSLGWEEADQRHAHGPHCLDMWRAGVGGRAC